jgi:Domain of unknown function (DUF6985)
MSRSSKHTTTLELPPLPLLTWDGFAWSGIARLPSWAGMQSRLGPYGCCSSDGPSDGTVGLCVGAPEPPPGETVRKRPPLSEQAEAYRFLLDHEHAIRDRIAQAVFDCYNEVIPQYLEHGYLDLPPALDSPDELRDLIGLSAVHVLPLGIDGVNFVGFSFGCAWDEEHGLGVMTWAGDVYEVGGADTAFCPL